MGTGFRGEVGLLYFGDCVTGWRTLQARGWFRRQKRLSRMFRESGLCGVVEWAFHGSGWMGIVSGIAKLWLFEDAVRHMALVSEASTTPVLCKTFAPRRVIAY